MFEKDIGAKLKRISNLTKREIEKLFDEKNNITKSQGMVLRLLYVSKQSIYQKDIEKELYIRRSTATNILNIMEQRELIKREQNKEDARKKKIIITEKGKKLEQKNYYKIEQVENKIKSKLTKEELNNLFTILDKIEKALMEEDVT